MQFTAVSDHHVVVNHHTGMNDAVGTDAAAGTDAHTGGNGGAGAHHGPLVDHGRGMNVSLWALPRMQAVERFCEGQAWIRHHRESDPPLAGEVDEILLVRKQQRPDSTFAEGCRQHIARLQKTQLIPHRLIQSGGTGQVWVLAGLTPAQSRLTRLQGLDQAAESHGVAVRRPDRRRAQRL